jgi:hypothetical protein
LQNLCCSEGSISPTKALNGSIEILIDASIIHNIPAAIQRAGEFGMKIIAIDASKAPTKK